MGFFVGVPTLARKWLAKFSKERRGHTPGGRIFSLASRGDWLWHFQGRPGLVDLSKTLVGTFFRRVHPGSEMAGQNGKNGLFCQNDQKDQNGLVF